LLLGLGNPILGDDGIGCSLAELIGDILGSPEDLGILSASVSPVRLVDIISGYAKLIVIDSISSGRAEPGELLEIDLQGGSLLPPSSHHFSVAQVPDIAQALGLPCPEEIKYYGIEIDPPREYGDRLSDKLGRLLPSLAEKLIELELNEFIGDSPDDPSRGEITV
jgi:hydrogenase maturation protease